MRVRTVTFKRPRDEKFAPQKTWGEIARETIATVHKGLPEDTPLIIRRNAIDAAYPFSVRKHYPYKIWCRERRNYLERFGHIPENAKPQKSEGEPQK